MLTVANSLRRGTPGGAAQRGRRRRYRANLGDRGGACARVRSSL